MKRTDDDVAALEWSLSLMSRAFRQLSQAFATVDAELADSAIHTIEAMAASELDAFCKKPPKGIVIDRAALAKVVVPFRQMTQEARALIQKAGQPEH